MPNQMASDAPKREQTRMEPDADASEREQLGSGASSVAPSLPSSDVDGTRIDAPGRDRVRKPPPQNWIIIDEALLRFSAASLPIKIRTLQKYCLKQKIRSTLAVTNRNTFKYFLDPIELDQFIAKETEKTPIETDGDDMAHASPALDAPGRDRVRDDGDVYEHPYVRRLEQQIEKLEIKYEAQIRRTEDIQSRSQEKILELQRMTAVGQSETLAQFMLKAKDWFLGPGDPADKREVSDQP